MGKKKDAIVGVLMIFIFSLAIVLILWKLLDIFLSIAFG